MSCESLVNPIGGVVAQTQHGLMLKGVVENHHFVRLPASFAKESFKAASPIMNLPENRAHFKRIFIISRNWEQPWVIHMALSLPWLMCWSPWSSQAARRFLDHEMGVSWKSWGYPNSTLDGFHGEFHLGWFLGVALWLKTQSHHGFSLDFPLQDGLNQHIGHLVKHQIHGFV